MQSLGAEQGSCSERELDSSVLLEGECVQPMEGAWNDKKGEV